MDTIKDFKLYKGLQKPLVFKSFKGRFIYWGLGSICVGLLTLMIVASTVNLIVGGVCFGAITGGGMLYTALMQRKGLHHKKRDRGEFIVNNIIKNYGKKTF